MDWAKLWPQILGATEFWASLFGAVVGGLIALAIQLLSFRQARQERDAAAQEQREAIAYMLFEKLRTIDAGLLTFAQLASDAKNKVAEKPGREGWSFLLPLGNFPLPMQLEAQEVAMLMRYGDMRLYHAVTDIVITYTADRDAFIAYSQVRQALSNQMPAVIDGSRGYAELSREEHMKLAPQMASARMLANSIIADAGGHAVDARTALVAYHSALKSLIGSTFPVEFREPGEEWPEKRQQTQG